MSESAIMTKDNLAYNVMEVNRKKFSFVDPEFLMVVGPITSKIMVNSLI